MRVIYTRHAKQRMAQRKVSPEQVDYDPQAEAIYIHLRQGEIDDTLEAGKYVYVDVDKDGIPLGLEILFAGQMLAEEDMTSVTVNIGKILAAN